MGASCGKGYAGSVQPESGDRSAEEFGRLHVDDSAADCLPVGYRAKRRQGVSPPKQLVSYSCGIDFN